MRILVPRPNILEIVNQYGHLIHCGFYSTTEFLAQTKSSELKKLGQERLDKIRDQLDNEIAAEGGFLSQAKIALDDYGNLTTCPFPLYKHTSGQTGQTHLLGMSLAICDAAGHSVCVKQRDFDNTDCTGSWAPPAAYMTIPVKDWQAHDYRPVFRGWTSLLYYNIRHLIKREAGLPEDTKFEIDQTDLIEVTHPHHQFEILVGIKSNKIFKAMIKKGWIAFKENEVYGAISRANDQNATAHLAAMTIVCDDPDVAYDLIRQI